MTRIRNLSRAQVIRAGLVIMQWILLTMALGAIVVYSADSLEGYITPNIDASFMFLGAFVAAFLLGISIESVRLLMPLAVLMCFTASLVFVAVLFAPSYADVTVRTTALENHAATRVMLFTMLMFLPALMGAGFGNFTGGYLRDDILSLDDGPGDVDRNSWYARRGRTSTADVDRS